MILPGSASMSSLDDNPPRSETPDLVMVLCTVPSAEVGASISRVLVEERLAACVSMVPGLRSIYRWKGQLQDDPEVLLVAKTRGSLYEPLRARIASLHPYEVAEIVAFDAAACHAPYLAWVIDATRQSP